MNRSDILEKVKKICAVIFETKPEDILIETSMEEIPNWDSLTHLQLISKCEEEFEIRFELIDIISIENIKDLVDTIGDQVEKNND